MSSSKLGRGALVLAAIMVVLDCDHHHHVVVEAKPENCVVGTEESNYWAILDTPNNGYPLNCSGGRNVTTLMAGDTLEFRHSEVHNVVKVSGDDYNTCQTNSTAGNSTIALATGRNYFMCTKKYEHCNRYGMKIFVNAN